MPRLSILIHVLDEVVRCGGDAKNLHRTLPGNFLSDSVYAPAWTRTRSKGEERIAWTMPNA